MLSIDNDTELFITNIHGDKYLHSANHNTLNKFGAEETHRDRFKKLCEKKDTLFIVTGTDSGTLLHYLNSAEIASGTQFILVELNSIYEKIKSEYPDLQLKDGIYFITPDELEETFNEVKINRYIYAGTLTIVKSLAAEYGFISEYHDLFFSTQTLCIQVEFLVQVGLVGKPFIKAQLENLSENIIPSTCLANLFPGKTAVILAGGPSLDELLPWVQKNRDNLVILAVSRVCRRLQDVGLVPDLIFSIDPYKMSYDVSKEMLHFWKDPILVHSYHVSPLLLGQWMGRSVYLGQRFPWISKNNKPSLRSEGPTVSNTALAVALDMGFSQIILAGVDLCNSIEGYSHAEGSNEHAAGPQLTQACKLVETNGGWMAETPSDFAAGIDVLHRQVQQAQDKNVTFINPAAGAAKIKNIQYIETENITLPQLSTPPIETLHKTVPLVALEQREKDVALIKKELVNARGKILHIKKLASEALQCNEGLFGRKGKKRDFKYKIRMDKIERKLNTAYKSHTYFLKNYGASELLKIAKLGNPDDWSDEEIEESAETYYSAYKKIADEALSLVERCRNRLAVREEELKPQPDYRLLFTQWEKDEQPGRLRYWFLTHDLGMQDIPPEFRKRAKALDKTYLDQFDETIENEHTKRCDDWAGLKGVQSKMQRYLKTGDMESLRHLQLSFQNHKNPQAKQYLNLCTGHIHEMEKNWEKALDSYRMIIEDESEEVLEEALLRIASISLELQDLENSKLAFESLSFLSPVYLEHYADLLRLSGAHQQAIDTYLNYIEKIPNDTKVMLKVGLYFRELNIEEGATTMFRHVLSVNPDNKAAKTYLKEGAT